MKTNNKIKLLLVPAVGLAFAIAAVGFSSTGDKTTLIFSHELHVDQLEVECETCHTGTYTVYTCYGCHDHEPGDMQTVHATEGIVELEPCGDCHPTGQPDEALTIVQTAAGVDPQAPRGENGQ